MRTPMRNKGVRNNDFEAFYSGQRDRCYRALMVTVIDQLEADDLLAEAFTRAWKQWDTVRSHPSPNAWVVRTALNLHRDRHRKSRNLKGHLVASKPVYEDVSTSLDPRLVAALRNLPEQQRLVIAFRVLLDLDTNQTASELGLAPGTVATHLKRGLASLRTYLDRDQVLEVRES